MTWSRDGSGLDVKRVRGQTLPQWYACCPSRTRMVHVTRWRGSVFLSSSDNGLRFIESRRKRRRDRRAKRLAKAAARRAERLMARIRPLLAKMAEANSRMMSARWTSALQLSGTYADSRTYNITVRDPAAPFDQPVEWDRAIFHVTNPDGTVQEFIVGTLDSTGGPTSEARAMFDQARQESDAAIARVIVGEAGHALGS